VAFVTASAVKFCPRRRFEVSGFETASFVQLINAQKEKRIIVKQKDFRGTNGLAPIMDDWIFITIKFGG